MIVINPIKARAIRRAQIMARFIVLDAETVRANRVVSIHLENNQPAPAEDVARLNALEAEAVALRAELESLNA